MHLRRHAKLYFIIHFYIFRLYKLTISLFVLQQNQTLAVAFVASVVGDQFLLLVIDFRLLLLVIDSKRAPSIMIGGCAVHFGKTDDRLEKWNRSSRNVYICSIEPARHSYFRWPFSQSEAPNGRQLNRRVLRFFFGSSVEVPLCN